MQGHGVNMKSGEKKEKKRATIGVLSVRSWSEGNASPPSEVTRLPETEQPQRNQCSGKEAPWDSSHYWKTISSAHSEETGVWCLVWHRTANLRGRQRASGAAGSVWGRVGSLRWWTLSRKGRRQANVLFTFSAENQKAANWSAWTCNNQIRMRLSENDEDEFINTRPDWAATKWRRLIL